MSKIKKSLKSKMMGRLHRHLLKQVTEAKKTVANLEDRNKSLLLSYNKKERDFSDFKFRIARLFGEEGIFFTPRRVEFPNIKDAMNEDGTVNIYKVASIMRNYKKSVSPEPPIFLAATSPNFPSNRTSCSIISFDQFLWQIEKLYIRGREESHFNLVANVGGQYQQLGYFLTTNLFKNLSAGDKAQVVSENIRQFLYNEYFSKQKENNNV